MTVPGEVLTGRYRNPQSAAGRTSPDVAASAIPSSDPASAPPQIVPSTSRESASISGRRSSSHPTTTTAGAAPAVPSTTRPAITSLTLRTSQPSPTTSPTSRTSTSTRPVAAATSAQLAAAITDYYALLPGRTDQRWARLTSSFQTGIAQNRQYYQRFWDSVGRVTATDAHGASPDTAEARITYYFKVGRMAVEPTVYSLVRQRGTLRIDGSTVLSSATQ